MAILSLDLGEKRVGVAISRSGIVAEPLMTLEFDSDFFKKLKEICEVRGVEKIIIGLPKSLGGGVSEQERRTKLMAKKIKEETKKEIEFIDERFTTKMAKERVKKDRVDEESAVIVLQSYLDSK